MLDIGAFRARIFSGVTRRSFLKIDASLPVALDLKRRQDSRTIDAVTVGRSNSENES